MQKRIVLCINLTQRKVSDDKPSKANSFEKKTNSFVNKSSKTNSSVDKFPKGLFPSVATSQMCNFPNENFPSGTFPMKEKRQLPKCIFFQVTMSLTNVLYFL